MDGVTRLRGSLALTRPGNAIAAGALTFIGAFVAGFPVGWEPFAAVAATILATGAGMGINDYIDREIDAINQPTRPIPSGAITARWALVQSSVLMAIAVGLALTLPVAAIAIAVINLLALVTYTSFFKGLPGVGNAVVAFLGGSTFLFGGAAVGGMRETVVLFLLAAFATLGREIIKDVEDVTGDLAEGLQTLPIVIGERTALHVASACLLLAVLVSPVPYAVGMFGLPYLAVVALAICVMLVGALTSYRNPTRGQQLVKTGMYIAIVGFVIGRLWIDIPIAAL